MYSKIKRLFDLFIAIIALLVLSPLLLPIVILLRLTGEGEIFYMQQRVGLNVESFNIYKFATMLKDSPNMGSGMITLRNDNRLTPMGAFLRKTKINELPQILNVLKGDMSIVGPRPTVKKHADAYPEEIRNKIYSSKPGITGIGSIIFRDEEDLISKSGQEPFEFYKNMIIPYKGRLELWYFDHKSITVDILIVFLTAWVIVFPNSKLYYTLFTNLPKREAYGL